eukprot:NODE_16636_length_984_cov_8.708285.p2 GENE.NODE_16636_length_984_cov_8.708285~~NODE_16636_length_984_cov_8.708285.p2  ORF type:complete len:145 (+),score=19.70 NODE_16636_length_984_cov_8.708285:306-740(+)
MVHACGSEDGRASQARSSRAPSHLTSERGAVSGFGAPSAIYAPSHTPSAAAYSNGAASHTGRAGGPSTPSRRSVARTFEPQGQGEIALTQGDTVTITHDPEEGQHNIHRWVYGTNNTTNARGWFPLSYTNVAEGPATEGGPGEY